MTFMKKTTSDKLADYLLEYGILYDGETQPAYVLTDETKVRAACIYEEKAHYIKFLHILCPEHNAIFIDAIARAAAFAPFEAGKAYALYDNDDDAVIKALGKMTRFKKVLPTYAYAVGVVFDEGDVNDQTYLCDLYDLFTNKHCGGDEQ